MGMNTTVNPAYTEANNKSVDDLDYARDCLAGEQQTHRLYQACFYSGFCDWPDEPFMEKIEEIYHAWYEIHKYDLSYWEGLVTNKCEYFFFKKSEEYDGHKWLALEVFGVAPEVNSHLPMEEL